MTNKISNETKFMELTKSEREKYFDSILEENFKEQNDPETVQNYFNIVFLNYYRSLDSTRSDDRKFDFDEKKLVDIANTVYLGIEEKRKFIYDLKNFMINYDINSLFDIINIVFIKYIENEGQIV